MPSTDNLKENSTEIDSKLNEPSASDNVNIKQPEQNEQIESTGKDNLKSSITNWQNDSIKKTNPHHYVLAIISVLILVIALYLTYSIYNGNLLKGKISTIPTTTTIKQNSNITNTYLYCIGSRASDPKNLSYYAPIYRNGSVGNWSKTTSYPYFGYGLDCFSNAGYVYCLPAGQANNIISNNLSLAYYANLSSNGIGTWIKTTNYPIPLSGALCYPYNNKVYCVGDQSSILKNEVYYANLSSNGIGTWIKTTNYPIPFYAARCFAYNGYLYCIGDGYHNSSISSEGYYMRQVRYSKILSNGSIGNWIESPNNYPLPLSGSGCLPYNGYIYCIGPPLSKFSTLTYYAKIFQNGSIGNWIKSTSYPIGFYGSVCTENNGFMYCIGDGETVFKNGTISEQYFPYANQSYYSKLTPDGFSNWTKVTEYPIPFAYSSCVVNNKSL